MVEDRPWKTPRLTVESCIDTALNGAIFGAFANMGSNLGRRSYGLTRWVGQLLSETFSVTCS
jgi:hypothetical protein